MKQYLSTIINLFGEKHQNKAQGRFPSLAWELDPKRP